MQPVHLVCTRNSRASINEVREFGKSQKSSKILLSARGSPVDDGCALHVRRGPATVAAGVFSGGVDSMTRVRFSRRGFASPRRFRFASQCTGAASPHRQDGAQQLTQARWRVEQGEQYYTFDVSVGEAPERSSRTRRVGTSPRPASPKSACVCTATKDMAHLQKPERLGCARRAPPILLRTDCPFAACGRAETIRV